MKAVNRRVLVADDQKLIRDGLRSLLDACPQMQVVAECATGLDVLEKVRFTSPDIVITDLSLPHLNGIELIGAIKRQSPTTHVLIYTMFRSENMVDAALRAGASGYVVKGDQTSDLLAALINCR